MRTSNASQIFLNFSANECKGSSRLYEILSKEMAQDRELLELSLKARAGQPLPNLFFGAVHYLLLKGTDNRLSEIYQNSVNEESWFPAFKEFCQEHKDEIVFLLKTKLVQTNEVRRCAYLFPVFQYIYELTNKPLALLEIGTSAGLQLLWDQYAYSYGTEDVYGNPSSDFQIQSEWIGNKEPPLKKYVPPVSVRMGFDLNIVDVKDQEEYLWMKALIWPEHKERLAMFERAASLAGSQPVQFFEGDGTALLASAAEAVPADSVICVFHTHVANQMPDEAIERLLSSIQEIGRRRDVFHLYNNIEDRLLHLDYRLEGKAYTETIAETDGHGRWFKWLLEK
ncbi:DUF2332 domain-containing protein [Metabacillus sp. KIGAM252]|uniref:DUF2332 domain-containing protein n=1 Tax=Metabacillus flavus TaxID=2823519 RepID=A0ABS5LCE5_9BACI|nr:DUF2332 domain-containing protein [Metabacillus flavus]MBS2968286.1 DUF2332 domain-containing protein [Metabacillus flavus]